MKCKYCQSQLGANSSVCPQCGKDNLKDSLLPLKIVALSLTCVVMLVLLAGFVCYGVTGSFIPNFGSDATGNTASTGGTDTSTQESFQINTPDGTVAVDNAGLQDAMNQVVATMGEHQLTNRELQLYYWMSVYAYAEDADLTKDLSTQIYDKETGKTYQDHCLEMALEAWQEVVLMAAAAEKAGYELPAAYVEELDGLEENMEYYVSMYSSYGYPVSSVDDLVQMQFGEGCNFATYYNYVKQYYLGSAYWSDMLLDLEVTEDQINEYYAENADSLKEELGIDKDFGNLVDFRNILILVEPTKSTDESGKTTSTVTDEDWEECRQKAQELYDSWIAAGGTEEAFIALVAENSADSTSIENEGLYEDTYQGCLAEVDVRHILIFPEGATSSTVTSKEWPEDAWAYAENKANEILNTYLAGELTEEAFSALAKEHSADGNAAKGGIYEDVYLGQMVKPFEDWCFDDDRQTGDVGIVKTSFGYHVMYFVRSDNEADTWMYSEERQPGDCALLKTDDGYEMLYFVAAEPAWYRYSRYGAQGLVGEDMLTKLLEVNPYTVDTSKVVLTNIN